MNSSLCSSTRDLSTKPDLLPHLLVVGHVTLDLVKGDRVPGSGTLYASLAATRLGMRVALLTQGAPLQTRNYLFELAWVVDIPSPVTTTFENLYTPKGREQIVHQVTPPIEPGHVPKELRECPMALLAPVARELDPSLALSFPHSLLAMSPQGWLRRWDSSGRVSPAPWHGPGESTGTRLLVV